jgi:hypothetical protein
MSSKKIPAADRSQGGPGSSHERPDRPSPSLQAGPHAGHPQTAKTSHRSGGGGERDKHHTHDPTTKS